MKIHNGIVSLALACSLALLCGCAAPAQGDLTPTPEELTDYLPLVSATGKVVPAHWSNLSVSTGGVVGEVFIEEGQLVAADELLMRLEGQEAQQAAVSQAKVELERAQQALDDLNKDAAIARQETLIAVADAYEAMRTADRQSYYFTVPVNQRELDMFAAADRMRAVLEEARKAWDPYKYQEEMLSQADRSSLKKKLDDAEGDFRTAMLRITYAADSGLAQARLEKALREYDERKDGPAAEDLRLAKADLENAHSALKAAERALQDLELRAPFAGEISRLNVRDHEWIAPGQTAVLLADPASLRIETTDLGEVDVARVQPGDVVAITYDALPDVQSTGKVLRISPKDAESSGVNYTVLIEIDSSPPGLRWGMTAFVDIRVE